MQRRARRPLGPAVPQLGDGDAAMPTAIPRSAATRRRSRRPAPRRSCDRSASSATCVKEAPEFADARRKAMRTADAYESAVLRLSFIPCRFQRPSESSTSSRSCGRSASRIREKRGVDYTEEEIRELANVKLEKFLDPRGVRSDLLEAVPAGARRVDGAAQLSRSRTRPSTRSHRGFMRWIRKLLNPLLKLFFNPNPLIEALHIQSKLNDTCKQRRGAVLRADPQPRARDDAAGDRGQEPEDARRVDVQPARLRRAARAGARRRGAVPAGRGAAAAAAGRPASAAAAAQAAGGERRPSGGRAGGGAGGGRRRPDAAAPDGRVERPARRSRTASGRTRRQRAGGQPSSASRRDADDLDGVVKLAVVVQRYGADINGGAELHARYIAEHCPARRGRGAHDLRPRLHHLAQRAAGRRRAGQRRAGAPLPGRARTPTRSISAAGRARVFDRPHSIADELAWLESEGPASPALVDYLAAAAARSTTSFSSAIATTTRITAPGGSPAKAVLVPTAERDPAIGLSIFGPVFRGVRAVMYNSPEERAMIQARGRQRSTCRASSSASARRCRSEPTPRASGGSSASPPVRDLHRPHRREQGLQASCSTTSSATPRRFRAASIWC